MDDNRKDTLTTWLKDAYAMKQGIGEVLESQLPMVTRQVMMAAVESR
jgi:ferritin-like metal-binding protein YciE